MKELCAILFSAYLLLMNAVGLVLMFADKKKACMGKWRIPENKLLMVAVLGGSVGCLMGMYLFHHKTRHPKFSLGIPAILLLQTILVAILWANGGICQ